MNAHQHLGILTVFLAVVVAFIIPCLSYAAGGGIDPTYKYAWSEDYGWVDFNAEYGDVQVTDSAMTGQVWNENTGWINLAPSASIYVHNDGQGNLSGYAWGEGLGYVNFSGVTIDAQGYFHGFATLANGTLISFNCANSNDCGASDFKVKTYWTPTISVSAPPAASVSSGGGGNDTKSGISLVASTTASVTPSLVSAYKQACKEVPSFDPPILTKDLKPGMQDADVIDLQKFLNTNGYPLAYEGAGSYGNESVYFGSLTSTALAKFQRANSLTSELGYAGPQTRARINKISANAIPHSSAICNVDLCPQYLTSYIRLGSNNDPVQVTRLKNFLRDYEGFTTIASTTLYDKAAFNDVMLFQEKFASDILGPWGNLNKGTGYVYKTTEREVNRLYCQFQYEKYAAS